MPFKKVKLENSFEKCAGETGIGGAAHRKCSRRERKTPLQLQQWHNRETEKIAKPEYVLRVVDHW
jgi:hypothetical protein